MSKHKKQITGNDLASAARETQKEIRAKLFSRGVRKEISRKTGLSSYMIRTTLTSNNPDLAVLSKIQKAVAA